MVLLYSMKRNRIICAVLVVAVLSSCVILTACESNGGSTAGSIDRTASISASTGPSDNNGGKAPADPDDTPAKPSDTGTTGVTPEDSPVITPVESPDNSPANTPEASPSPSDTSGGAGGETPQETKPEDKPDYFEIYAPLLEEWESAYIGVINGGNPYDWSLYIDFYDMGDLSSVKAYYALHDIDDNGIPELVLRKESAYEDIIAYIFTVKDDSIVNIFGENYFGDQAEVPWSRVGSSIILSSGLIDSTAGDYCIYRIADDGCTAIRVAQSEPYDYADEAS